MTDGMCDCCGRRPGTYNCCPRYGDGAAADTLKLLRVRAAIGTRLQQLQAIRDSYLQYQRWRVAEHDHHGAWDVAINLSETECEMAGLRYALAAIEEEGRE